MVLRPGLRKSLLILHISCSVGMLGTVAAFLLLAIIAVARNDPQTLQAAYLSMDMLARLLILPLVLASLVIGVVQSLLSNWGLFRHWWIVVKLVVSIIVPVVLLLQMPGIRLVAAAAAAGLPLDGLIGPRIFIRHPCRRWPCFPASANDAVSLQAARPDLLRLAQEIRTGKKIGFLRTGSGVPRSDSQTLSAARSLALSVWCAKPRMFHLPDPQGSGSRDDDRRYSRERGVQG